MGIFDEATIRIQPSLDHQGYRRVYISFSDGRKYWARYARFLMEQHMNMFLPTNFQVHHIDGVRDHDVLENLVIVPKSEHKRTHNLHLTSKEFICPACGAKFVLDGARLSQVLYQNKNNLSRKGPFCSKSCAGSKAGKASLPILRSGLTPEYYIPCREGQLHGKG